MNRLLAIALLLLPSSPAFAGSPERDACAVRVKAALCVNVLTSREITQDWEKAPCAADSDQYLAPAMELYDEMPDRMRPLYCSLKKIFLSEAVTNLGFAEPIIDNWEVTGAYVAFRLATFIHQPDFSALSTWKEQLAFGGSHDYLAKNSSLVRIDARFQLTHLKKSGLFYVLMHELAHVVDLQNKFTDYRNAYKWEEQSWIAENHPKYNSGYLEQHRFCYYHCAEQLKPHQAYPIYKSLEKSAFISTYAGWSSREDFAEYWVWFILREFKNPRYLIEVPGEPPIDMLAAFSHNPKMAKKFEIIQKIWDDPDTKIGFKLSTPRAPDYFFSRPLPEAR